MSDFEACSVCKLPMCPNASEWLKQQGLVCVCGSSPRAASEARRIEREVQSGSTPVPAKKAAPKAPRVPNPPSPLEELFAQAWADHGSWNAPPVRQYKPLADRKFQLDFSWPERKVAVEIQGRVHCISSQFYNDCERTLDLACAGWTILFVSGKMLRENPESVVTRVCKVLREDWG